MTDLQRRRIEPRALIIGIERHNDGGSCPIARAEQHPREAFDGHDLDEQTPVSFRDVVLSAEDEVSEIEAVFGREGGESREVFTVVQVGVCGRGCC